ncbi:MAG: ATP-binding protein [Pseudomonadota bacterium]
MKFIKNFWQNKSIVVKQLLFIITISIVIILVLDVFQNKQLKERLSDNMAKQLQGVAEENRRSFDIFIKSTHHAVKLVSSLKRFTDYIDNYNQDNKEIKDRIHFAANPPAWLPKSSVLRSFYKVRLALLLSNDNKLISAYYHRAKTKKDTHVINQVMELLEKFESKQILRKLSHNQSYMTEIHDIPYAISNHVVKNRHGKIFTLILLNPLDNRFLADAMREIYHKDKAITLLINSENNLILSSSEVDKIKTGVDISDYSEQYLIAGKSFFDYGASDLTIQFCSLIPYQNVNKVYKDEIYESRKQKLLLALLLIIASIIVLYKLIIRIKKLTYHILQLKQSQFISVENSKNLPGNLTGDEIQILYQQFNLLITNIEQNENKLYAVINEKVSKEKQLSHAMTKAEKANRSKSEFLSSMSHELRTPLNAILGFSQLLAFDKSLTKVQLTNIQKIYNSGKYLLELINDLLDLSRIEEGKLTLNIETININSLLDECYQLTCNMAKKSSVKIYNTYKTKNSQEIQVDAIRLKQIVINLLSNAVKYHGTGESIVWLNCKIIDSKIIITVRDNGLGIAKEKQQYLFQPFNRLGSEKSHIEGTGIGLVISKKLITMMGGTISIESSLDEGTNVTICLPLNKESND